MPPPALPVVLEPSRHVREREPRHHCYFGKYGCYNLVSERGSVPALTRDGDLLGRGFDSVCISLVSRVWRLSACGCVTLLPPPKLQAISPRVFVIGDYVILDVLIVSECVYVMKIQTAAQRRWKLFEFIDVPVLL
ncbi:hypothetical protein F2Q68_00015175 [Brassica cretica]|uniref:Uncharacterized protein n=1 Tax=Brassica cretica TaxID=69181 RepID=A0A8S9HFY3_BRACR|nr:hypothetical protein F2Q68_00015175 [Brassica cretica]